MNWKARSSSTEVNDEEPTHSIPANLDDNEPANGRFHRRIAITREIDSCLTSCDQCTGAYEDSVNGYILRVICRHGCHSAAREVHTSAARSDRKPDTSGFARQIKGYDYASEKYSQILNPIS